MRKVVKLVGCPSDGFVWIADRKPDDDTHVRLPSTFESESDIVYHVVSTFVYDDVPVGTVLTFTCERFMEGTKCAEMSVYVTD